MWVEGKNAEGGRGEGSGGENEEEVLGSAGRLSQKQQKIDRALDKAHPMPLTFSKRELPRFLPLDSIIPVSISKVPVRAAIFSFFSWF